MTPIFDEVSMIIRNVLKLNDEPITRESSAETVRGWDSLSHIAVILAVESKFKIKFKASEISSLANLGELVDLVESRVVAQS